MKNQFGVYKMEMSVFSFKGFVKTQTLSKSGKISRVRKPILHTKRFPNVSKN